MPLAFVSLTIAALAGTKPHEAGLASGLINTSQQIGGAVGIAILSTIATSTTSDAVASGTPVPAALTHGLPERVLGRRGDHVRRRPRLALPRAAARLRAGARARGPRPSRPETVGAGPSQTPRAPRSRSGRCLGWARCGSSSSASSPGMFSSLFGVGGGIVIVPLLILVAGFGAEAGDGDLTRRDRDHRARRRDAVRRPRQGRRRATPLLVGIPAVGGAMIGTASSSGSRGAP